MQEPEKYLSWEGSQAPGILMGLRINPLDVPTCTSQPKMQIKALLILLPLLEGHHAMMPPLLT